MKKRKKKEITDLGENLHEAHKAKFWFETLLEATQE